MGDPVGSGRRGRGLPGVVDGRLLSGPAFAVEPVRVEHPRENPTLQVAVNAVQQRYHVARAGGGRVEGPQIHLVVQPWAAALVGRGSVTGVPRTSLPH